MTKYILHGGATSKKSVHNDEFFAAFSDHNKKTVNILLCYWARKKEEWNKLFKRDVPKIRKNSSKKKKLVINMVKDESDFNENIKLADTIYFAGGDVNLLKKRVLKIKNIKEKLEGKLVIGSSAGAYLICKYSVNSFDWQAQSVNEGLGLLPLSVLAHFDIEGAKDKKIQALKNKANLPIVTLDEGKFTTFLN